MKITMRLISFLPLLFFSSMSVHAQTVEERSNELEKISELITQETNPLKRIANFENLLKSGNTTNIDYAIKIALRVQEANLRALALRAYFAHHNRFVVEADFNKYYRAMENIGRNQRAWRKLYARWGRTVLLIASSTQGRMPLVIDYSDIKNNNFLIIPAGRYSFHRGERKGRGNFRGQRLELTFRSEFKPLRAACVFQLTVSDNLTLTGMGHCNNSNMGSTPRFPIRIQLF